MFTKKTCFGKINLSAIWRESKGVKRLGLERWFLDFLVIEFTGSRWEEKCCQYQSWISVETRGLGFGNFLAIQWLGPHTFTARACVRSLARELRFRKHAWCAPPPKPKKKKFGVLLFELSWEKSFLFWVKHCL